jgi:hypothetical protein
MRNVFIFPAMFLGYIAMFLHASEPIFSVLLLLAYLFLIVSSALDNPFWYVFQSVGLTTLQLVVQLKFPNSTGGVFYICVMALLYTFLIANIIIAGRLLYFHYKTIRRVKTAINGQWAIISSGEINKHTTPHTVLTFNDNYTGSCIDFYGMKNFTYKINPKVALDSWPHVEFRDRQNKICIALDFRLPNQQNSILQLGEEYAFEDDFRGYMEDGELVLLIEPIYSFKRVYK